MNTIDRIKAVRTWISRIRTGVHTRRALSGVDSRTLRDIGLTHRDIAVLNIMSLARPLSPDPR